MNRSRYLGFALFPLALLFLLSQTLSAQCYVNPTGETAVGLQNSSSYFLTFFVDGVNLGGVPAGDKSVDFLVTPGSHELRAEAYVNGEAISASRSAQIPAGYVCTWTVTDAPASAAATKSTGGKKPRIQFKP